MSHLVNDVHAGGDERVRLARALEEALRRRAVPAEPLDMALPAQTSNIASALSTCKVVDLATCMSTGMNLRGLTMSSSPRYSFIYATSRLRGAVAMSRDAQACKKLHSRHSDNHHQCDNAARRWLSHL